MQTELEDASKLTILDLLSWIGYHAGSSDSQIPALEHRVVVKHIKKFLESSKEE